MQKRIPTKYFWLALLCALLFCGCGKGGPEAGVDGTAARGEGSGVNEAASFWVKEMEAIPFEKPEEGYAEDLFFYGTLGDKVCLIRTEYPQDGGEARLCVQIYNSGTKKTEKNIFTLELPDRENWYVVSANLIAGEELSLKLETRGTEERFLVKTDLRGKVLEVEDPFPSADDYPWNPDFLSQTSVFALEDGRILLSRWDSAEDASVLTWFDGESGEKKTLGRLEGEFVKAVCCGEEESILYYYPLGGGLVRWDIEKDLKEELIPLYREGILVMMGDAGLIRNDRGEFLFCTLEHEKETVYVLTNEEAAYEETIRLSCVQEPTMEGYLQKMAATFSRERGGIPIVPEGMNEPDQDDYRDRIFAELAAGKGPELLLLSYEDMRILQEKGLLCDLEDFISQDTLEQLIPGVVQLGTVNGRFTGITPEAAFLAMLVADATWAEDEWSISEFTELLKGREDWEWPVIYSSNRMDYYTLFWMIFGRDLSRSPFLDLEQGSCSFDSETFLDILELCRKYGQPDPIQKDTPERIRMLQEGESLAMIRYMYMGQRDFSSLMKACGESCHIVGFPGEEGSVGYIVNYSSGYLAVNAASAHREEIEAFLNYLLSYEKQYEVNGTSVRMDVIRDSVVYDEAWKGYVLRTGAEPDAPIMEIALKPDGASYMEEFLDFIENCEPEPVRIAQLSEIIGEELVSCFEGGRSAGETAATIQRRVQLYLDENMR